MLLTVSTTHAPATDLGYLLHKHPDRVQAFGQSFGTVTVFYPEATPERCTAALLLEIDPVRLARGRGRGTSDVSLSQYVNDRPYAASSLLAVAMGDVLSTARAGRCRSHQDLADAAIPLEIEVPVLPCRGGPELAAALFAPLGWQVDAEPIPLDETFPEWGDSRYLHLRLRGELRLADALNQLYVLLPVLDESKHYWQGPSEVDKLLRSGEGWLTAHPEAELITRRYLGHHRRSSPRTRSRGSRRSSARPPASSSRRTTTTPTAPWRGRSTGSGTTPCSPCCRKTVCARSSTWAAARGSCSTGCCAPARSTGWPAATSRCGRSRSRPSGSGSRR